MPMASQLCALSLLVGRCKSSDVALGGSWLGLYTPIIPPYHHLQSWEALNKETCKNFFLHRYN